jgi:hypothetical protein
MMKINKQIEANQRVKNHKKSKAAVSLMKYKSRSELLIEEYQDPSIPRERMYVIDKVVRMRGL